MINAYCIWKLFTFLYPRIKIIRMKGFFVISSTIHLSWSLHMKFLYIFLKFTHKLTLSESLCLSLSAYLSLHDECLLLLSQFSYLSISLSRWLSGKETTCWCRIHGFDPWVWKIPQRRKWEPTPALLSGKSRGQGSLVGYNPWGRKESDVTWWLNSNNRIQRKVCNLCDYILLLIFNQLLTAATRSKRSF